MICGAGRGRVGASCRLNHRDEVSNSHNSTFSKPVLQFRLEGLGYPEVPKFWVFVGWALDSVSYREHS